MDNIYDKIHFLVNYLNEHTEAYDRGYSIISDKEWDEKYFELKMLEEKTGLILGNSPTQVIPYETVNSLSKVEHNHKMLSLDKTKSIKDVINFIGNKAVLAMCKMDGLTCSLTYENGELISAETRGNGLVGEDILHNAKVINSIPKHIPYTKSLVIDGEIICTHSNFENFQNEYKNPRNFAAGSIRLLSSKECSRRNLTFVAWDVITSIYNGDYELSVFEKLNFLKDFGFTLVPALLIGENNFPIEENLNNIVLKLQYEAADNQYPIDGIVFKFNDCAHGRSLGETTHHFRNALAYKFYDEIYESELINIEWTMGRTGVLTPIAVFNPIEIEGSVVERASLHNVSIMEELSGGYEMVGDIVHIFKANQIIPQVDSWNHVEDYNKEKLLLIPEVCPICGEKTTIKMDIESKTLVCGNPNCLGKLINRLDHFCGKKGLDIKGISKATLEKLIDWGWVSSFTDIFELSIHKSEWVKKIGFGVKSVEKILDAIQIGSNCELHQFIAALGIPLVGTTAAKELANHFKTWDEFISAINNKFKFYTLPNFGGEMHHSIINFNYTEARLLVEHYITFKESKIESPSGEDLTGKTFVITGKLSHFKNREEIKSKIESLGGKVTSSVSKNTHYLINNDINSTSSKNTNAKSLGIPILSEEDFIQTFGISN